MSRSILPDFNVDLATLLLESIQLQRAQYYYFLGRTEAWGDDDRVPASAVPVTAEEDLRIRSNIVFLRKIEKNNVSLATKRFDWSQGNIVPQWDHTLPMVDVGFYVVTDEDKVYVCLDNAENSPSLNKPQLESFYPFRTADGYLWKYMYSIPAFKKKNFMTVDYLPVQNALSDSFYNNGAIEDVVISDRGIGYFNSALTTLTVNGTTSGSGATVEFTVGPIGNILTVTVTNGGSGYDFGCDIDITSATGSGVILTPVIAAGVLTGVTITAAGVGYDTGDVIAVTVGGAVLIPRIKQSNGSFDSVSIDESGSGYSGQPTIAINYSSGTPSGFYPENATALLDAVVSEGRIVGVLIRDPGINYPVDSATIITVQGDGSGAEFTPIVYNGEVVDVIIDNPGIGYNTIVLNVIGPGTDASISAVISDSNFQSNQSVVEQTAIDGGLHAIKVSNPGEGYGLSTTVQVVGNGTGCVASAIIGVGGSIARIVVSEPGYGYSKASIIITDTSRNNISGSLIDATAYAIISPIGGHGKDQVKQLNGSTLVINTPLTTEPDVAALNQEFRQFGILKEPKTRVSGRLFKAQKELVAYKLKFSSVADMEVDELLAINEIDFRVVSVDVNANTAWIQSMSYSELQPLGTMISKADNLRLYDSLQILVYPIADKYSGKLIYVSNENPFAFNDDQGIVIRTFLDL